MERCIIVIPCYNESARLRRQAFLEFARTAPEIRFLLVNDGSTDGTLEALRELHRAAPEQFRIHDLAHNAGKAEAVRRGILQALEERPQWVGFWDADLATPLEAIPDFCEALRRHPQVQIVLGSRLPLLGRRILRNPVRQHLGRVFAAAASLLLGLKVYDTQCGAKLFRAGGQTAALFERPFCTRWIFDVELLARLIHLRRPTPCPPLQAVIYEFPLERWTEVAGSKLKAPDFFKAFFELIRIWWNYLRPGAVPPTTLLPAHPQTANAPESDSGNLDRAA
jgi:glycosyltransferase involved in cell wall biosynthesis